MLNFVEFFFFWYIYPFMIVVSSWWIDLGTWYFSQRSSHSCCLTVLPGSLLGKPVKEMRERKSWQRCLPHSSVPKSSFSRFPLRVLVPVPPPPPPLDHSMNEIAFGAVQKEKKSGTSSSYTLAHRDLLSWSSGQKDKVSLRILSVHAPLHSFAMGLSVA